MIRGFVNESGCAIIKLKLRSTSDGNAEATDAWVDTGFTGELALPRDLIRDWSLPAGGVVRAILADGRETRAITYLAHLDWFGENRPVEVVDIDGTIPLLGVQLLLGCCLKVDYARMKLSVDKVE